MNANMQKSARRKACDICYRKRIKCDGQKPRCTHCVLYESACTFEASSRKAQKRQKPNKAAADLQARVESLEASLRQAEHKIHVLERKDIIEDSTPNSESDSTLQPDNGSQGFRRSRSLDLPPQHEVLSAVRRYLATLNSTIPLFNPDKLLRVVDDWYVAGQRDSTTWGTINMVLALAHRQTEPGDTGNATTYIKNAQSVLVDVTMEKATLLRVQFLAGMILLFQGVQDLKPATMLIAIAVRLAHELRLHTQTVPEQAGAYDEVERTRIFWILYLLDRDISLRTQRPPIQREMDIGLEWPAAEPSDGAGTVIAADGKSSFNFFLARVQLAQIQGEIYDAMYSAHALTRQPDKVAELHDRLNDWAFRVPNEFRPDAIIQAGDTHWSRAFGVLYASHLACRSFVCQAHAMEMRWLEALKDFGTEAVNGNIFAPAPEPIGWHDLVNESRAYMRLFESIEQKDPAFIWMAACTYMSAGICLVANNIFNPQHSRLEYDESLAVTGVRFLDEMIQQVPYEALISTKQFCEELLRQARALRLRTVAQITYI